MIRTRNERGALFLKSENFFEKVGRKCVRVEKVDIVDVIMAI